MLKEAVGEIENMSCTESLKTNKQQQHQLQWQKPKNIFLDLSLAS